MIDLDESELKPVVMREVQERVAKCCRDDPFFGKGLYDKVIDQLQQMQAKCRLQGIDFPRLVPIVLPSEQVISFHRADLDRSAIQTLAMNFTVIFANMRMAEIASAIHAAYPDYRPD